jgi:hypothetical protein
MAALTADETPDQLTVRADAAMLKSRPGTAPALGGTSPPGR